MMPLTMTTRCSGYFASANVDAESQTSSPPCTDSTSTFFGALLLRWLKQPITTSLGRLSRLSPDNFLFFCDLNPNPSLKQTIRLDLQNWQRPGISAPNLTVPSSELATIMRGGSDPASEMEARGYQRGSSIGIRRKGKSD